jgi:drug/metabolite transporter (DMT)-like permease
MKEIFLDQSFFSGLAWSRLGGLIFIPLVLLSKENRTAIWQKETGKTGNVLVFFFGRVFSASGFILINLAYSLTSPTIVNALQGIQYAFLFIVTAVLTKIWPNILKEMLNRQQILIKTMGISFIILGTILIAF